MRTTHIALVLVLAVVGVAAGAAQAQPVAPPPGGHQPPPPTVIGGPTQGPPPPTVIGTPPVTDVHTRPVIERIEPTSGPAGTTVTIVGRNFTAQDQVTFGGQGLPVQSVVPTRITVVVPGGILSGHFTVQGPGGSAQSTQTFNIVQPPPPPSISGFSPGAGVPGTDVAIEGSGFSLRIYEDRVSINGLVVPVRTASTTRLTVTIPEGAADGTFVVDVANAGAAQSAAAFDVLEPLRIDRVVPVLGPVGTQVQIFGSGFSPSANGNTVKLGDKRCAVRSVAPGVLLVEVPARAATGTFVVSVAGRGDVVSPEFQVVYPPVLRSFTPRAGFPGTEVTLSGEHFGTTINGVQVSMSGVLLPISAVNDREVRVRIPDNAGTGVIQLTIPNAGSVATPQAFEVWAAPAIASFTPARVAPDATVTVLGRGFVAGRNVTTVTVNGAAASVQSVTDGQIVLVVPHSATTGRIHVAVRDRGEAQSATDLVIIQPPRITAVSPRSAVPGDALTITGEGFGSTIGDVTVTYTDGPAGAPTQTLTVLSLGPTQIVAVAPSGANNGRITVSVRNVGDASASYHPGHAAPVAAPVAAPPAAVIVPHPVAAPPAPVAPPGPPPPTIVR